LTDKWSEGDNTMVTQTIPLDILLDRVQWIDFLDRFTCDNRGAHGRMVMLSLDIGYQVETSDQVFVGIGADIEDGESAVWITFGSTSDDHLTHGIQNVSAIRVLPRAGRSGAAVLIETRDSIQTLLELTCPEDYALPPTPKEFKKVY
jgi:hypothetical protein